jgi:putative transposase
MNDLVHNFWTFRTILDILSRACERAGIRVHEAPERGTSSHCALCGMPAVRPARSRVVCQIGHELHADVNGALNLLDRDPEVRGRAGGRPTWRTLRWNGHRWVPTRSALATTTATGDLQAAPAGIPGL